jgi:hypothetical protein
MQRAAAAGTPLVFDIDDLFDPFEMRGQRTAVGLARTIGTGFSALRFVSGLGLGQGRLDILKAKLKLIGIELLRPGAEPMAHERIDDRLEPFNLCIGLALGKGDPGGCGTLLG